MRKTVFVLLLALLWPAAAVCGAQSSETRGVDITVTLGPDGSASVKEVWDISIWRGTEWYLVRENLGDIVVSDLRVRDESGREYVNEGGWNTDRSISAKAGRCGILRKKDGCEICWGLGSHGDHVYTVEYRMSNAVKAMDDFDAFHMQLVSPGIEPAPRRVRVEMCAANGTAFSDANCGIWAFGFEGTANFTDGKIVAETTGPFSSSRHSVILLARFDKGIFQPSSRPGGAFQDKLDTAFKGSSYEEYLKEQEAEKTALKLFLSFLSMFTVFCSFFAVRQTRKRNLNMFGVKKLKEIGYERDLPFDGNLYETRYILSKTGQFADSGMAAALILDMIKKGAITIAHDASGKVLLNLRGDGELPGMSESQKTFYGMLRSAAGSDLILQDREYSSWSRKHEKEVSAWVNGLGSEGASQLARDGFLSGKTFTEEGRKHARRAIGFRKYLKDFTLLDERKTTEVALWGDYIIYAALFGIADKVAKELKDINPKAFEEAVGYDYPTMHRLVYLSNRVGGNVVSSAVHYQTSTSVKGGGGFSSFGGGGGFSGGGFGGGAR